MGRVRPGVNGAQTFTQILDAYYGGTTLGSVPTTRRIRVRLVGHDNSTIVGVVSIPKNALWAGMAYGEIQTQATATAGRYDIWASATPACPHPTSTTGWTRVAIGVATPIRFTTNVNESSGAAGDTPRPARPTGVRRAAPRRPRRSIRA